MKQIGRKETSTGVYMGGTPVDYTSIFFHRLSPSTFISPLKFGEKLGITIKRAPDESKTVGPAPLNLLNFESPLVVVTIRPGLIRITKALGETDQRGKNPLGFYIFFMFVEETKFKWNVCQRYRLSKRK